MYSSSREFGVKSSILYESVACMRMAAWVRYCLARITLSFIIAQECTPTIVIMCCARIIMQIVLYMLQYTDEAHL